MGVDDGMGREKGEGKHARKENLILKIGSD